MKKILLGLFLVMTFYYGQARKFYISSSTGNDTYTISQAQNSATPWKTLVKVQSFGNSGQAMAGDTFAFKCGDLFTNGYDWFGSFRWWSTNGYTCPSGTAANPIVFTSYGTGSKPNLLFPYPSTAGYNEKHVFALQGVKYIVIDGLQFNDTRFSLNDKVGTAYTSTGILLGERGTTSSVNNCTVKNCFFSNIGFGIQLAGDNNTLYNNVFINMKNVGDTSGSIDVGAIPIVLNSGKFNMVKNNYLKGGWAFSGATASGRGLNGGGFELLNDFDSSWIIYNTIIDCEGGVETGQNINQVTSGPNDDIIAYNLFLNNGKICYANTGSSLSLGTGRLRFYNNVYVENTNSRFSGDKYGMDVFGDGQSFSQFPNWPNFPQNPSYTNFGGWRPLQYTTEAGVLIDTVMISRNNIFWMTNYNQAIYDNSRVKFFHANNIYHLIGRSVIGGTLNSGDFLEMNTSHKLFTDTSNSNPEFWDFNPLSNSPAINFGRNVGFTSDIVGNALLGNPDAGIKEYINSTSGTLVISVNVGNVSCYGGTTTAIVTATGGVSPYTGTGTFTVSPGTQTFTVTDAVGTRQTLSVTVNQPAAIVPTVTAGRIIVTGGNTTITATATGGTGAYTYKLNSGSYQSSGNFTGVLAGTHTVSVKDANGCVVSNTVVITQPSALLNLTVSAQNNPIVCNGGNTTVTATATGGTAPYTYSVSTGAYQSSNQFAGIVAGTYTFNVKDSNGVVKSTSITLTQPTAALSGTVSAGTIAVYGAKTTITVSNINGGTSPYSYSLNGGVYQTATSFSNVAAGTHVVTIKDSRGCTLDKNLIINQPPSTLACSSTATNILCNGGTATVTVSATGGTSPYTGTGNFTVASGTYTYTVTDAAGSVKTTTITVNQPTAIVPTVTAGRIIVTGGNTTITASATGGTGAYSYRLNNGTYQSSGSFTGVLAGTHTVSVKDANGCVVSSTVIITQPAALLNLTVSAQNNPIACNGGNTTVTATATGGTAPYTYSVGTGAYQSSNQFAGIVAGTYTFNVKDSNGVVKSTSITLTQPTAALSGTVSAGTIAVYGAKTTITVSNINGGTSPYSYSLNGGVYQTATSFSNVAAGTYVVTIKDNRGCTLDKSITINQPPSTLACSSTATNILCNGGTATVTVSATGGTSPYTGTGNFTVASGTYTYTVTDAAGSVKTTTITVNQPTAIVPTVTAGRIIVTGGNTTITASATGGTGAYSYRLNNGTYQSSGSFTGVLAGTHTVSVKDANGCVVSSTVIITQPSALLNLTVSAQNNPIVCNGGNTTVTATATGGTAPYTYSVGTGAYQSSNQFAGLLAGTYTFNVKDFNGVVKTANINLTQAAALSANVSASPISIYGGRTIINVTNVTGGSSPYTYSLNGGTYQTIASFSNITAGLYVVTIKDSKGCTLDKSINITQPISTLACSASSTNILCNGGSATVTVTATGGTAPYTGIGNFTVAAGTHTFSVTDAAGSVKTTTITVGQPTAITSVVTSGRILINGGATSITVSANGGTGAFTYKLNNGNYQTSNVFGNILAGVDTVYVKDANGCVVSSLISIDQPSQLVASSNVTPISCFGGTAQVAINATGGIPPYTGIGNFNVIAGNYNYTVIDSAGATQNISITINQPTQLTSPTLSQGAQITVYGAATTVTVSAVSGGTAPYSYSVDNGIFQTSNVLSITGGAHVVNVKDSKGCTISKSITISQPLKIFLVTKIDQTCAGIANGSLTMRADGGVRPYTYRIYKINNTTYTTSTYPYQSDSVFNGLAPNFYTIRVKDNAGTLDTLTVKISATTITCNRGSNNNNVNESESAATAVDKGIQIFPNPSSSEFNIIPNHLLNSKFTYQLYNSTGQKVGEGRLNNDKNTPVGRELKSGVYFMKVFNGELIETKKLIKL